VPIQDVAVLNKNGLNLGEALVDPRKLLVDPPVGLINLAVRVRNLAREQCLSLKQVLLASGHIRHRFFQPSIPLVFCSRHDRPPACHATALVRFLPAGLDAAPESHVSRDGASHLLGMRVH
jgi:hypothetical protein